jgi:hypothetical protein
MALARGIAATALGVLIVLIASAPARAQCSYGCTRYEEGQCVEYQSCTPGSSSSSGPAASYGAIAYGRTSRAWGYSFHWGSEKKAESVALHNCAQHGDDCEVMVWFMRKCGAVAAGEGTDAYWGLGNSDDEASADAKDKCVNGGGKDCEVQVTQCSK